MDRAVNVLALVKDGERYLFMFDGQSTEKLLQTLGEYAADDDLTFTWYDAAVLSQRIRNLQEEFDNEFDLPHSPW